MPGNMVPNPKLTRRSFAALCGAATGVAFASPVIGDAESFRALSAKLTGFDQSMLDPQFATQLRQALLVGGHAADLEELYEATTAATAAALALETDIISAWYSGVIPLTPPVVGKLYGALVWSAADFATPPGMCAGGGGWSGAPGNGR